METQLLFNSDTKQLALGYKQKFTAPEDVMFRLAGHLNTVTGTVSCRGSLFKHLFFPKNLVKKKDTDKGLRTRLGAGVLLDADRGELRAAVTGKGYIPLGTKQSYIKVQGQAEYNTQTSKSLGFGKVQLTRALYDFTSTQDLKLSVGYKGNFTDRGKFTAEPFGELRENNWSIITNFKGSWQVKYDL